MTCGICKHIFKHSRNINYYLISYNHNSFISNTKLILETYCNSNCKYDIKNIFNIFVIPSLSDKLKNNLININSELSNSYLLEIFGETSSINHFKFCKPYLYNYLEGLTNNIDLDLLSYSEFMLVCLNAFHTGRNLETILNHTSMLCLPKFILEHYYNFYFNYNHDMFLYIARHTNLKPDLYRITILKIVTGNKYDLLDLLTFSDVKLIDKSLIDNTMLYTLYKMKLIDSVYCKKLVLKLSSNLKMILTNRKYINKLIANEISFLPPISNKFKGGIIYLTSLDNYNNSLNYH